MTCRSSPVMNNPAGMADDWMQQAELRLDRIWPIWLRLAVAAGAVLFLGWELTGAYADARSANHHVWSVFVVLLSAALLFASAFATNVRWTIRPDEIRIERQHIFGRPRIEIVQRADIRDVTIFREATEQGWRIWLLLDRLSARSIESPAARLGTEPDLLKNAIATRLLITPSIKQI